MAYRRVRNYGYTMGATSGTETPNSSRAPEYTSGCLLPVVTLTCSRVVAHYGSLFSSVFLSWWRKQTLQGVRDNASALLCCLPGDVNTFVNLIKACSHSSFHRNIEPFSHSLCNGLAMIAKFFHIFHVIGANTKKAPLICLGVFGLGQSWTVLTLSGPVLIPSSETTCSKKT
jgi:hypothetical protein